MKEFRCTRDIISAEGTQEFAVKAKSRKEAIELFKKGRYELVESNCEVIQLGELELNEIWEEC